MKWKSDWRKPSSNIMNKDTAKALAAKAEEISQQYSNPNRKYNYGQESFTLESIIPHSDQVATVVFLKSSGKRAAALFYYIPAKKVWRYWFPTDSHVAGLQGFREVKLQIEQQNFQQNFVHIPKESHESSLSEV